LTGDVDGDYLEPVWPSISVRSVSGIDDLLDKLQDFDYIISPDGTSCILTGWK
jgi:hypothetical protein